MSRVIRIAILYLFAIHTVYPACAQESNDPARVAAAVREYRKANEHKIIAELVELLAIPNVATDTPNIQRNAAQLRRMLERRGFAVRFLPIENRGPVIYAELQAPGATRTVIFYCHYDGQPVDPEAWLDAGPFEPILRTNSIEARGRRIPFPPPSMPFDDNWRIYARSASDDKSPIVAILAALDALRAKRIPLGINVKLLLDGEEEAGSPNLENIILANRDLLAADLLISADGPVHQSGRPLVSFGNRGVLDAEITVYGPARPLHSGHYGNWAPNPAMRLAQLLATMKDDSGRVLIDGFYDDMLPLSAREQQALADMPANDADLKRELKLGGTDGSGKKLVELITEPSLNIRGIRSAYVGEQSQNIIPTHAVASLDLRLVKNIEPDKQFARLVAHIRKQGYFVVQDREPSDDERRAHPRIARVDYGGGYPATRTSMDLPASQAVVRTVDAATAGDVVRMPTFGGSVPMYIFDRLAVPEIGVPIVNHDNNQHAQNENLRIGNFWRGMEIFGALLAALNW